MRDSTRQTRIGTVVSNKMDKTVVVQIETQKKHPLYKKFIQRRTRFKAHDEQNDCNAGDVVRVMETRPLSKDKRWRVVEVIERGFVPTGEVIDPTEMFRHKKQKRDEKRAALAAAEAQAAAAADSSAEDDIEEDEDLELEHKEQAPAPAAAAPEIQEQPTADEQAGNEDDSGSDKA